VTYFLHIGLINFLGDDFLNEPAAAWPRLIVLLILLVLSGFFSSSETALTTVNKIKIKGLVSDKVPRADIVLKLIENPTKMLSTILIGNNIVNLSASSLTTSLAMEYISNNLGVGIATFVLTLLVLIFGEITPKSLAAANAEKLSLKYAYPIYLLSIILTPFIIVVNFLARTVMNLFGLNSNVKKKLITETELRTIVDVSHEEGVIESEERQMIENVVDFGDAVAKDVMVPQIDIAYVESDCSYDELVDAFNTDKFTRLPVYHESKDNIIGIINLKDVFFYNDSKENFDIKKLVRKPFFTYEYKKTSELFIEMKKNSIPIAIVLDEYGSTVGLLTIEDLVEEIVGEIRDEYDNDEEEPIKAISETEFEVNGSTKLDDINDTIGLTLESKDYDSIAGHIISLFEHIPFEGESITNDNIEYTVKKLNKNRIEKIYIKVCA